MPKRGSGRAGDKWQRRLLAARIEAALTNTGTALLTGATGVLAAICMVGEMRGSLNPGTWAMVLALGAAVTLVKAYFDFRDRSNEGGLWRSILIREFGDDMRRDGEAARLARLAIEFRARLSAAEAGADPAHAQKVIALLPRVDDWLDQIVSLARKVAALRGEARFQAGLATRAKERVAQIASQARASKGTAHAGQLLETARALSAQVNAFDGFSRYVDDGFLRLEHAVGAFTAACSQIVLELSRSDKDLKAETGTAAAQIFVEIGNEMAETAKVFADIGQLEVPDFTVTVDRNDKPEPALGVGLGHQ